MFTLFAGRIAATADPGGMPAIKSYWRKGMNRAEAPYLPLTPEAIGEHLRGDIHIGP